MKLGEFRIGTVDQAIDKARAILELAARDFNVDHVSFEFSGRLMYVWVEDTREQTLARCLGQLRS